MQKLKKFLSLALALVIVFGAIAPAMAAEVPSADDKTGTKVNIFKVLMSDTEFEKKDENEKSIWPKDHDGSALTSKDFGTDAKFINGVAYTIWEEHDTQVAGAVTKTGGKFLDGKFYTEVGTYLTENGGFATVNLADGTYVVEENYEKSTYVGENGETLTKAKAVPFRLELPAGLPDGTGYYDRTTALNIYPKNTEDKPKVDKDFEDKTNLEGPDSVSENQDAQIGDEIPYEIKSEIPAGANYKTAYWSDQMTEGLTFDETSVTVKLGETVLTKQTDTVNGDYILTIENNGFKLALTDAGLAKINKQPEKQTITITYKAVLNSDAVVEIPESNDVTFHYGNNPGNGNTPIPTKPLNGKMTVTKTWAEGTAPTGVKATFQLYNAQTGAKVGDSIELPQNGNWTYEWTGLDNDIQYKVVEEYITGYSAEYGTTGDGQISVKNYKDNNPKPIDPTEPKVVTYGKKFVKTNDKEGTELERLAGAEFIIANAQTDGEYLARKSAATTVEEANAVSKAKTNLDEAIEYYKALTPENQTDEAKATVENAQKAYNDAVIANGYAYEWTTDKANPLIVKLVSNEAGQFEITGLKKGDYYLEEIKAPEGYALLQSRIIFEVNNTSYNGQDTEIKYEKELGTDETQTYGQQVPNKKVTIPQTGGIGTVIFTVGGIALMGGAAVAMKKNKEEDAE